MLIWYTTLKFFQYLGYTGIYLTWNADTAAAATGTTTFTGDVQITITRRINACTV